MFLGINYNGMHDSSVCLVGTDGIVRYAVSEERFSRVKQDGRFPHRALATISLRQVHAIGVPYLAAPGPAVSSDDVFRDVMAPLPGYRVGDFPAVWRDRLATLDRPLAFFDHHDMHAYSAYILSGYSDAIVLTCDNGAYTCPVTAALFHVRAGATERIAAAGYGELDTLASLYSDVTALLGFTPCKHEGKVTGLAAHGIPRAECRRDVWRLHRQMRTEHPRVYGWIGFCDDDVPPFYEPNLHQIAQYRRQLPYNDADIARAAQDILEEKIVTIARWIKQHCGTDLPLLLSGGVFANVKLNLEIARLGFRALFVCPPMGDEGLAIGAARAAFDRYEGVSRSGNSAQSCPRPRRDAVALGPDPGDNASSVLEETGVVYHRLGLSGAGRELSDALISGQLAAVVRGRQEFGPRALGLRSVLAGAGDPSVNDRLNAKLRRTDFMPFAPILRAERFADVFDLDAVSTDVEDCGRFMTICLPVQPWVADKCPVVVHADGTARPQVLRREDDPFLHDVLARYEERTGLPLLVNTSFNIHDEPVVSSATDAVAAFLTAELDVLLLEDCLVRLAENSHAKHLARLVRRPDSAVAKARHAALNRSFGRQIFEGPGRFNDHAPSASTRSAVVTPTVPAVAPHDLCPRPLLPLTIGDYSC